MRIELGRKESLLSEDRMRAVTIIAGALASTAGTGLAVEFKKKVNVPRHQLTQIVP